MGITQVGVRTNVMALVETLRRLNVETSRTAGVLEQLQNIEAAVQSETFETARPQQQQILLSAALQMLQKVMEQIDSLPEEDQEPTMERVQEIFQTIQELQPDKSDAVKELEAVLSDLTSLDFSDANNSMYAFIPMAGF